MKNTKLLLAAILGLSLSLAACNSASNNSPKDGDYEGETNDPENPENPNLSQLYQDIVAFLTTRSIEQYQGLPDFIGELTDDVVLNSYSSAGDDEYAAYFYFLLDGNLEEVALSALSELNWTVPAEPSEYGYECVDPTETVEIDLFYSDVVDEEAGVGVGTNFFVYAYDDLNGGSEAVDVKDAPSYPVALSIAASLDLDETAIETEYYETYGCLVVYGNDEGDSAQLEASALKAVAFIPEGFDATEPLSLEEDEDGPYYSAVYANEEGISIALYVYSTSATVISWEYQVYDPAEEIDMSDSTCYPYAVAFAEQYFDDENPEKYVETDWYLFGYVYVEIDYENGKAEDRLTKCEELLAYFPDAEVEVSPKMTTYTYEDETIEFATATVVLDNLIDVDIEVYFNDENGLYAFVYFNEPDGSSDISELEDAPSFPTALAIATALDLDEESIDPTYYEDEKVLIVFKDVEGTEQQLEALIETACDYVPETFEFDVNPMQDEDEDGVYYYAGLVDENGIYVEVYVYVSDKEEYVSFQYNVYDPEEGGEDAGETIIDNQDGTKTVTLDFSSYSDQQVFSSQTSSDGVVTVKSVAGGGGDTKYFDNGSSLRIYWGTTLEFKASEGHEIVSVTFTCVDGNSKTVDVSNDNTVITNGTLKVENRVATITANEGASTVSMNINLTKGNVAITSISISYK